ncbi:MAG: HypC/HybG/HupF family hydrogenase formation chaperone [Acidimicrobiia bacterium]|nr:HypC/HybG/HupF family hydrogenase formation chaperone [Acidimicrobiia bacterium]
MCVAVPGQITWIGEQTPATIPARIENVAGSSDVDLVMVPGARVGDYVIAHSGYAIRVLPPEQAAETLRLLGDHT